MTLYAPRPDSVPVVGCSPPSWAIRLTLIEKQLPFDVEWLDFAAGEHRTDRIRQLNPRGTVPILTDGEAVVHETGAILDYLEDVYAWPPLMPSERQARATALTRYHEATILKTRGMALLRAAMQGEDVSAARSAFTEELARWEAVLDEDLWCAGEHISLVDLLVFPYLAATHRLGLPLEPAFPLLSDFHREMMARESARRTVPPGWSDGRQTILG